MTDITDLRVSDVGTMTLRHPLTNEPIAGAELDVYGRDSRVFRTMVYEEARSKALSADVEERDRQNFERCCRLVMQIRGIEESSVPIKEPAVLFARYPWALEQVQAFLLDRRNFMRPA